MFDLSQARMTTLAVHKVGNKVRREGVIAADNLYEPDADMTLILQDFFLKSFKAEEFFKFTHEADLKLNEIFSYCQQIFEGERSDILPQSINMLQHLYSVSEHPHIKSGEFYVAHFRECVIDNTDLEAIGIFKTENKDLFLQVENKEAVMDLRAEEGINLKKLDKGCLIFKTFAEDGYSLLMVDKSSEDTQYWRDDFLHVERIQDHSYQTQSFMALTRDFVDEVFSQEQDKKEQVVFLNKSLQYFNQNKEFDLEGFKDEVIPDTHYKEQFDDYRKVYENQMELSPAEEGFPISRYAVRNMRKQFKSSILLDTQIEIKLNPKNLEAASEWVERHFDEERGMFYYKVYFNEELEDV